MDHALLAGAAAVDITPHEPQFLYGYPRVERISTGVHDPLLSSAIYFSDGRTPLLLIACDVIFIDRETANKARGRIERLTGIPSTNIIVSATHTHSGPTTVDMASNEADPVVPKTDPRYLQRLIGGIVESASIAVRNAFPAGIGLALANGSCVGTNRHDPDGPFDPQTPVLLVRDRRTDSLAAMMIVCSMHPTVLHEDSTQFSGDFPGMTRRYLQRTVTSAACPVIYHTGPCGNLSPRHVTKANTFEEAERLGTALGRAIEEAIDGVEFIHEAVLSCNNAFVYFPPRPFPTVPEAQVLLRRTAERLQTLRQSGSDKREQRSAECDWFGAEETLTLSRVAADGALTNVIARTMPAEIVAMRIGPWTFIGWPGEVFVEFAHEVKSKHADTYVISLANGELQGYLATEEAVRRGTYEALNSLFASPQSGNLLVEKTFELLRSLRES